MNRTVDLRPTGFTMIELIVVLAVVGIIAGFAAPQFQAGRWRAQSGAQEVMMALGAAQRLAVLRQHDVAITFRIDDRVLEIHQDEDNDGTVDAGEDVRIVELPETIGFGLGPASPLAGDPSYATVTFIAGEDDPRLVFHRNGSASEAGRVYVRPRFGSMSDDAGSSRALLVERATGEVRCFSFASGTWEPRC